MILNNRRDDMLCGHMFTVESSQSDEFYHSCKCTVKSNRLSLTTY